MEASRFWGGVRLIITTCESFLTRIAQRRHWLLTGIAAALFLSLMITFPRISFFTGKDTQIVNFWPDILQQAQHPLSPDLPFYKTSIAYHQNKLAFRLTLPVLARLLHLNQTGLILLQMVLGVLLLAAVAKIIHDLFGDRVLALATVFGVSAIYAGKAGFIELGGVGDAPAFAFLAFAAAFRPPLAVYLAIVAAAFTDERGVIACFLIAMYWAIRDADDPARIAWLSPRALAVGAGLATYAVLRLYLGYRYGLHTPLYNPIPYIVDRLRVLQWEIPHALAGLWLWVVVAAVLLWRARSWWALILTALNALAIILFAAAADIQRSMAFLLPLLFISWAVLARLKLSLRDTRDIAVLAFLFSLLIPVNSYFYPSYRYADANLFPVEMVRFVRFVTGMRKQ